MDLLDLGRVRTRDDPDRPPASRALFDRLNVPAAIVLASAAATYGWPAVLGACALSGLVIAALALAGLGRASMRFIPLPLVMGLFAGSILRLATGVFEQLGGEEPLVAAAAVAGYFATRLLTRDRVPATLGAMVLGLAAVAAIGRLPTDVPLAVTLPRLAVPAFDLGAFAALVLPVILLVVGTGNVQALGFLRAQGYRPPADRLTLLVGLMTTVQTLFGGTPAGMARVGAALVGGHAAWATARSVEGPRPPVIAAAALLELLVFAGLSATGIAVALLLRRRIRTGDLLRGLGIAQAPGLLYFLGLLPPLTHFAPLLPIVLALRAVRSAAALDRIAGVALPIGLGAILLGGAAGAAAGFILAAILYA